MLKNIPELKIILTPEQITLLNKMTSEINKSDCKAVCFRMSDTLVSTPFSECQDLFLFMEDDFRKFYKGRKSFSDMRIYAEQRCPKNIDMIYDFIMNKTKITKENRDALLKRECELFADLVFPRNFGKRLFEEAQKHKKKVIIVADTVYPRKVIVNVLDRCGYGRYNQLIVANELETADVYDTVIEKSGVQASKILNISGDIENDIEKPIMKGSKALLLTDTIPLMVKSGRLRGFIQAKYPYSYDSADFLAFHLAMGLYGAYMFDMPKGKAYQSDFCKDAYMVGFIVLGTLRYDKNFCPDDLQTKIISACERNEEMMRGADDFRTLFSAHFNEFSHNLSFNGFSMPFEFFSEHSLSADRNLLSEQLEKDVMQEWENHITEPKTADFHNDSRNQNVIGKLADRMFPKGTKIRTITDGVLSKMKQIVRL